MKLDGLFQSLSHNAAQTFVGTLRHELKSGQKTIKTNELSGFRVLSEYNNTQLGEAALPLRRVYHVTLGPSTS